MNEKYQDLDDAILAHFRRGFVIHPTLSTELNAIARDLTSGDPSFSWRLIDRRIQAMRKSGRLVYQGRRWTVAA